MEILSSLLFIRGYATTLLHLYIALMSFDAFLGVSDRDSNLHNFLINPMNPNQPDGCKVSCLRFLLGCRISVSYLAIVRLVLKKVKP